MPGTSPGMTGLATPPEFYGAIVAPPLTVPSQPSGFSCLLEARNAEISTCFAALFRRLSRVLFGDGLRFLADFSHAARPSSDNGYYALAGGRAWPDRGGSVSLFQRQGFIGGSGLCLRKCLPVKPDQSAGAS